METALKIVPKEDEVSQEVMDINGQAKALEIIDSQSYLSAGELWKAIKGLRKKVDETFSPIISAAFQAHKTAVAKKKEVDIPLEEAEKTVKQAMSDWDRKQEYIRLAEQKRLEEIFRKEEEGRRIQEAIEAEEQAKANGATAQEAAQEAEAILSEPVYTPPVVLPKETPKVAGVSFRTIWDFEVVNASLIPRQFLSPDLVKIGGVVRSLKEAAQIPGIKVFSRRV